MKNLLLTLIFLSLYGCVIPPGKLTDDDFIIKRYSITEPTPISMERYREGYRHCDAYYGVPECILSSTTGKAVCDIYGPSYSGGKGGFVMGRVDMTPVSTGTNVEIRLVTWISHRDYLIDIWKHYVAGNYDKACPVIDYNNSDEEDEF